MANCFIIANPIGNQVLTFAITDTKLYVPVVTLSTQDMWNNSNNWNQVLKEQSAGINIDRKQNQYLNNRQNQYLNYPVDPSFQQANTFFVLLFCRKCITNKLQAIYFSYGKNKRLQCFD